MMGVTHGALMGFTPSLIHIVALVDRPSKGGDS
jgi:hypothetical protein